MRANGKFFLILAAAAGLLLSGCSTNPATGERQFTAFMSPSQEQTVGESENASVLAEFGAYDDRALADYVSKVGAKVAADTERPDVHYSFTVLDTPMVNAFALPGGYVYVSRGLLAQANSEAELAAVLGHEIGHITGRHSAERYSHGVLTSLGAGLLAAATESDALAQAAGIGSDLYIKSYSRSQELQADSLGLRYLHNAGYDPGAMASFLANLGQYTEFEARLAGESGGDAPFNYFSTHPRTAERIEQVAAGAQQYAAAPQASPGYVGRDEYLRAIDGVVYGDSARHGFVRGRNFYHPGMDFTFSVPKGFRVVNQPGEVIAAGPDGTIIVFDAAKSSSAMEPLAYLTREWMRGEPLESTEQILINGKPAATGAFAAEVGGRSVQVRIVAVQWSPDRYFRFQMAVPRAVSRAVVEELKSTTYSLRPMTEDERRAVRPERIKVVTAGAGDDVASLASRMANAEGSGSPEERFRALNALAPSEVPVPGRAYKIVVE